jgi:hypothetical protein
MPDSVDTPAPVRHTKPPLVFAASVMNCISCFNSAAAIGTAGGTSIALVRNATLLSTIDGVVQL